MRALLLVMVGVVVSSCNPGSTNCVPGHSVACVGVAGCSGGQVCRADGSGYGECACGGSDAGVLNGGTSDAGPTAGALVINWTLSRGGQPSSCAVLASGAQVSVILTPVGGGAPIEGVFACEASTGTITSIPFGTYTAAPSTINAQGQSTGTSASINITFDATGCTSRPNGDCGRELGTNIALD